MSADGGRGSGAPSSSKPAARKFVPTMPGRRKVKTEDGLTGVSAADAAAGSDSFKDLMKDAESEATWERGGRGRGRGRGQRFQVTFGGMVDRPTLSMSKPSSKSGGGSGGGVSGSGAGGGAGGGGRGAAAGTSSSAPGANGSSSGGGGGTGKPGTLKPDGTIVYDDLEMSKPYMADRKVQPPPLDYRQYFPILLPLKHPEAVDYEDEEVDRMAPPVPTDLAYHEDAWEDTARNMGLLDGADNEELFLVQMPCVLPIRGGKGQDFLVKEEGGAGGAQARSEAAAVADAAAAAAAVHTGCSARELPSGCIGKLLVFKSGKVKMVMADVLMDVSLGLPVHHRGDVAAINCHAKHCVLLGDVFQRLVVSPNVWQLMADTPVPDYVRELGDFAPPVPPVQASTSRAGDEDVTMIDGDAGAVAVPTAVHPVIKIKDEVS
ncbi:MAG: hypothetical protein WDW36_002526 [Sanguina aurantia]